ncbi:hypothetical protein [Lysinibacillus pakistanensis]|uniref:hypothetical protein n=1 Tax=Lysinibacillus pakistanensis TaxID=759811 RepID=UPI003D2DEFE6
MLKVEYSQFSRFPLQNLTGVFAQLNQAFQDGQSPSAEQLESYLLGLYMRRDFVLAKRCCPQAATAA